MSALPVIPAPTTPTRRRHLVAVPAGDAGRGGLAPVSRAQAWRRRLGALVVVACLLALAVTAVLPTQGATDVLVPVATETVVVEPGQTLWDIARTHAPAGVSTAEFVEQLRSTNALGSPALDPWQVLRIPAA